MTYCPTPNDLRDLASDADRRGMYWANIRQSDLRALADAMDAITWIKTSEQLPDAEEKVLGWYIRPGIDEDFFTVYLDGDVWKLADDNPHYPCEAPDYWMSPMGPNVGVNLPARARAGERFRSC